MEKTEVNDEVKNSIVTTNVVKNQETDITSVGHHQQNEQSNQMPIQSQNSDALYNNQTINPSTTTTTLPTPVVKRLSCNTLESLKTSLQEIINVAKDKHHFKEPVLQQIHIQSNSKQLSNIIYGIDNKIIQTSAATPFESQSSKCHEITTEKVQNHNKKLTITPLFESATKSIVAEKLTLENGRKESESQKQISNNNNTAYAENSKKISTTNNESKIIANETGTAQQQQNIESKIIINDEKEKKSAALNDEETNTKKILSAVCNINENNNNNDCNESKSDCHGNNLTNEKGFNIIDVTDELISKSIDDKITPKLTESSLQNSIKLQRTQSKTESVLEYLNSVEPTVTEITEKFLDFDTRTSSLQGSSSGSVHVLNDSESEEDDQLKPLMQDNHTVTVNHEFYIYNVKNPTYHDIMMTQKQLNNLNYSSTDDSDMSSAQYDQRDGTGTSQNSSDDNHDSGLDTLSSRLQSSAIKNTTNKQLDLLPPAPATTPISGVTVNNTVSSQTDSTQTEIQNSEVREIDTLSAAEIPDDKLCEFIVEAVEYYFSNDSLLKDAFLLKHVRRNKEGFVSLKLISSFKRVRQYTKDWRVVGIAVERKSKKVELNDVGTKVRRLEPLPNYDETMPSRTIVVCDLPFEKLSIDKITDIFAKCGEIALVRILKPGMQIPVDVRQFMNKYPEMQQKECALVEFIDSASARFAKSMQGDYKVYDMVAPKKKTGKKSITTITKFIENYKYPDTNYERTRGGESGHHYHHVHHNYNHTNPNNQQQSHHLHCNISHNQGIQNNSNFDNEINKIKLRPSYLQTQNNQDSQLQNLIYQPPHMQQRRFSASDQENSNRENIQNMNNLNNQIGNNNYHFNHFPMRRMSNSSLNDSQSRKYSSCSEGYSSCSEYARRPSLTSSQDSSSRKTSTSCSEYCPCSRRSSQCSDIYRKISQTSDITGFSPNRRFSNGSFHSFERQYNNNNDQMILNNHNNNNNIRRISFDSNYDRKMSASSINGSNNNTSNSNNNLSNSNNNNYNQQHNSQHIYENNFRKYSNGFDPNRKLSFTDQYFTARRISADSGYDRKLSLSSDTGSTSTSPRSRANSFIIPSSVKPSDVIVRTPIGPTPDSGKGFATRARKVGQMQSVN